MTPPRWPLFVAVGVALVLRVWLPFGQVFPGRFVNVHEDAWYHLRAIDHLVRNFPHRLVLDPYAGPDGMTVAVAPLFDVLVASLALLAGFGSPSAAVTDTVAAVLPALLGSVSILLTYAIGRRLFGHWPAVAGAALLAIMPGHFLHHTMIGSADHHALESVFSLSTLLLLMVATAPEERARLRGAAPWLAGVTLGLYCLTWTSAAFFVAALIVWLVIAVAIAHVRSHAATLILPATIRMSVVALAMVLAFQHPAMPRYSMQLLSLGLMVLLSVGWQSLLTLQSWRPLSWRLLVVGLGAAAIAAAVIAMWWLPETTAGAWVDLRRLTPALGRLVGETVPLLFMDGRFSLLHPWGVFRASFYVAIPGLVVLGMRVLRRGSPGDSLMFVWTLIVWAATLGQNRFGYYLAPMLALLAGWGCAAVLTWTARRRSRGVADLIAVAIVVVVAAPSLSAAIAATRRDLGMPAPWHSALHWLRDHSRDPFDDPDYYFASYRASPRKAEYTVMNWWEHGYWIMREARRVPVSIPTQAGAVDAARFLTATTETSATSILATTRSRYVVIDRRTVFSQPPGPAPVEGIFESVASWAGEPATRFSESMFQKTADGRLVPVRVFYPDYYRSMAVRLMVYGGAAVEPVNHTWVITYADRRSASGKSYRELTEVRQFRTYGEAQTHLHALGDGPHRIAGRDPAHTCVPLEALTSLQLLHDEPATLTASPVVRVFGRLPGER